MKLLTQQCFVGQGIGIHGLPVNVAGANCEVSPRVLNFHFAGRYTPVKTRRTVGT
jgi:hypothetical protein